MLRCGTGRRIRRLAGRRGRRLSARGTPALADGPAGPDWRRPSAISSTSRASPRRPFHLVGYVAPGSVPPFARSGGRWSGTPSTPRPRNACAYVGLAPLFLAVLAMAREFRRDRSVRVADGARGGHVVPEPGPLRPGFRLLIRLPGFSFFRAPARWVAGDVAGAGDPGREGARRAAGTGTRPGRSLGWLAAVSVLWVACDAPDPRGWPWRSGSTGRHAVARRASSSKRSRPGRGPTIPVFGGCGGAGRRAGGPRADRRELAPRRCPRELPREPARDLPQGACGERRPAGSASGWSPGCLAGRDRRHRSFLQAGLVVLTIVDFWLLGQHRMVSLGPARPLVEQSPVLAGAGA